MFRASVRFPEPLRLLTSLEFDHAAHGMRSLGLSCQSALLRESSLFVGLDLTSGYIVRSVWLSVWSCLGGGLDEGDCLK